MWNNNEQQGSVERLEKKEWNDILDHYLAEQNMTADEYEYLDNNQRIIINEIKKSFKRSKRRV